MYQFSNHHFTLPLCFLFKAFLNIIFVLALFILHKDKIRRIGLAPAGDLDILFSL